MAPGSPADLCGLRPTQQSPRGIVLGDEIVAVDGRAVASADELMAVVDEKAIGESIEVGGRDR